MHSSYSSQLPSENRRIPLKPGIYQAALFRELCVQSLSGRETEGHLSKYLKLLIKKPFFRGLYSSCITLNQNPQPNPAQKRHFLRHSGCTFFSQKQPRNQLEPQLENISKSFPNPSELLPVFLCHSIRRLRRAALKHSKFAFYSSK